VLHAGITVRQTFIFKQALTVCALKVVKVSECQRNKVIFDLFYKSKAMVA
jgi:hypothetical protein